MTPAHQQLVRDSFLTNVKSMSEINESKMEATRAFWQDVYNARACSCNKCGTSFNDTMHFATAKIVLVLQEYPIIIHGRKWYCEECKVSCRDVLLFSDMFDSGYRCIPSLYMARPSFADEG